MKIDGIVFDLFDTLISTSAHIRVPAYSILGIEKAAWLGAIHSNRNKNAHQLGFVADPFLSIGSIARSLNPSVREVDIVKAVRLREENFREALTQIDSRTIELLSKLREKRIPIGVLSNAYFDEIKYWKLSPIRKLVDVALFSCQIKLAKPDVRAYRLAKEQLNLIGKNALFCGDGDGYELVGAKRAGFKPVLLLHMFTSDKIDNYSERLKGSDFVCRTFDELEQLVSAIAGQQNG